MYGRHCHRYLGKVKFFQINWITKMYQKRHFSSGGAFIAPPLPHAGLNLCTFCWYLDFLSIVFLVYINFRLCISNIEFQNSILQQILLYKLVVHHNNFKEFWLVRKSHIKPKNWIIIAIFGIIQYVCVWKNDINIYQGNYT